jgi:adenine-specific DNA-methyltransferase
MLNKQNITQNIKTPNTDIEMLKINFPHCFDKNGDFDFEKFKKEISSNEINFSKESYGMDWLGKSYARLLATDPAKTLIKEDGQWNNHEENKNSENLLIKGDNLEVLKHLSNAYQEKVKMIYIDPPYNTGSDGFVYEDDRKFTAEEFSELAGVGEEQAKKILSFVDSKSNSHSAWLTFMYPRLYIAKQLLKDDGVIFVSIDDNEVSQLRILMDEIFGEENFISILSVENNPKGRKNSDFISVSSEHLLIFAKNKQKSYFVENIPKNANDMTEDSDGNYVHNSGKRVLVGENSFNNAVTNPKSDKNYSVYYCDKDKDLRIIREEYGISDEELISKKFVKYSSYNNGCLVENTYTEKKLRELFENNALDFSEDKIYEKNFNDTIRIKSQLVNREYEAIVKGKKQKYSMELTTTGAGTYLKDLFQLSEVPFSSPKNVGYLKLLISLFEKEPFIVLDFFSGSGTTGDAVMQLNAEDKVNGEEGNRKYILVQLPEPIDPKKNKTAFDFVKNELGVAKPTIFEITKERLIRAGKKIQAEQKTDLFNEDNKLDFGFKIFETQPIWGDYEFEAKEFDAQTKLFDESKLSSEDLQTLLTTWKTYDNILLTESLESINLDEYTGYYGNGRLYLMDKGFKTKNLKALLNKIDEDTTFNPVSIIVFGYHFESKVLREIAENVSSYTNKKKLDIDFITRY